MPTEGATEPGQEGLEVYSRPWLSRFFRQYCWLPLRLLDYVSCSLTSHRSGCVPPAQPVEVTTSASIPEPKQQSRDSRQIGRGGQHTRSPMSQNRAGPMFCVPCNRGSLTPVMGTPIQACKTPISECFSAKALRTKRPYGPMNIFLCCTGTSRRSGPA